MLNLKKSPTFEDFRGSFSPLKLKNKPDSVACWDQVNVSVNNKKGTFRGMHYQSRIPQQKYIKVVKGSIVDYLYDLNTKECYWFTLKNQDAIFVPKNFAHGFLTLEDNTIVTYLVEGEYDPTSEHSIPYMTIPEISKSVHEKFSLDQIIITDKDAQGK